jgi:predicted lipoprotein with Yx(FWY)xxD motif
MRRALALLAVPALALAVSACTAKAGPIPQGSPKDAAVKGPDELPLITISESPQLGWHVITGEGKTMYRFDADSSKPPKSICEGECAQKWPPVLADTQPLTAGVDPMVLGVVTRSDGTKQLTIGGFPQYTYAEDSRPGDAKGQGNGGKWYATNPAGSKASLSAGMPGVPGVPGENEQPARGKQADGNLQRQPTSTRPAPPSGDAGN